MRTLDDVVEHTHDDDAEEQPEQGSESDAPPRTTPVQVPENSDAVSEPTSEFVMPDIVTAQPSGEVPQVVEAESAAATTHSAPAFLGVRRQVVLRRVGGRPRVRRVSRVLRHIDPL